MKFVNFTYPKATAIGIGAACLTLSMMAEPSQAARFDFNNQGMSILQNGYLEFTQSPLRGSGYETVSLSDLTDAYFVFLVLDYNIRLIETNGVLSYYWGNNNSAESVLFNFQDGNLVGLNFQYPETPFDGSEFKGGYYVGVTSFTVEGNSLAVTTKGNQINYSYDYEKNQLIELKTPFNYSNTIPLTFITSEPLPGNAVPEPLTLLGAATAFSFGILFKKSSTSRKDKRRSD